MAYGVEDQKSALEEYERQKCVLSHVAKLDEYPSRPVLAKWRDEGLPHEVTGGKSWDEYLREKRSKELEKRRDEIITKARSRGTDLSVAAEDDIPVMLQSISEGVKSGEVELKISDYIKLVELQERLQSKDEVKLRWAKKFVLKVFSIITDELRDDMDSVHRIKEKVAIAFENTKENLDVTEEVKAKYD